MSEDLNLLEKSKRRMLDHPWIAGAVFLAAVVVGIGGVFGAFNSTLDFFGRLASTKKEDLSLQSNIPPTFPSSVELAQESKPDDLRVDIGVTDTIEDSSDVVEDAADVVYVRESSAAEIVIVMDRFSRFERGDRFNELFQGRWVRSPGWEGEVSSDPKPNQYAEWHWSIGVIESESEILFMVFTKQDLSTFRVGDKIRVVGQLNGFMLSPSLGNATVELLSE